MEVVGARRRSVGARRRSIEARRRSIEARRLSIDCRSFKLDWLGQTRLVGASNPADMIFVLPPYQRKGYGRHLLEVLNNVAVCENVYDLTIEEPLDSLQHVRTCIDVGRLLVFNPIQKALNSTILHVNQENLSKTSQT
ncbi:hypothetical protein TEA_004766 [Camellia sinensis var. sinensis]|uniref:N-acetyltransferase domain-containing protein n=1 Tax=Camellia sinensis var. sinensis TaxID=542762 RepID=A0A4S4DCE9_CAMSN|nr:hypothetical protein TEA_004766 [Camellia sinensis var. sinensis]